MHATNVRNKKTKGSSKRQGTMMWRGMEVLSEKCKIGAKAYNTAYSQVVTQPSTDAAQQDLTSVIGREPVCFLWCGRRRKKQAESCVIDLFYREGGHFQSHCFK